MVGSCARRSQDTERPSLRGEPHEPLSPNSDESQPTHPPSHGSNTPLCNAWLALLRGFGIEAKRDGDSTGVVKELAG